MPVKHRDLIIYVLNELVKSKELINNRGILRKVGKKYRFVPSYLKSEYSTRDNSRRKTRKNVYHNLILKIIRFNLSMMNRRNKQMSQIFLRLLKNLIRNSKTT